MFLVGFIPVRTWRRKFREFFMYRDLMLIKGLFIKKRRYDCIFSMGDACFVARALKAAGLRNFSGPFDWLRDGDFESRVNLLMTNFADFCNHTDFEYAGAPGIWRNRKTGLTFMHDFTKDGVFDDEFPAICEKYRRRTTRLIEKLKNSHRVLIVYGSRNIDIDEIKDAIVKLRQKFGTQVEFLCFKCDENYRKCRTAQKIGAGLYMARVGTFEIWGSSAHNRVTRQMVGAMAGISL